MKGCGVQGCRNSQKKVNKGEKISFYKLPSCSSRKLLWLSFCGVQNEEDLPVVRRYICGAHFHSKAGPTSLHPDPVPKNKAAPECNSSHMTLKESDCYTSNLIPDCSSTLQSVSCRASPINQSTSMGGLMEIPALDSILMPQKGGHSDNDASSSSVSDSKQGEFDALSLSASGSKQEESDASSSSVSDCNQEDNGFIVLNWDSDEDISIVHCSRHDH